MDIKRSGTQPSVKGPLERLDGNTVDRMEKVTDEQYRAGLRAE
jgi:hypothetical protein